MSIKPHILILSSNQRNIELMIKFISPEGYQVQGLSNLSELDEVIKNEDKVDLVLMDISGFDKRIWDACENLRNNQIPFLMISPQRHIELEKESIKHGAQDFLVKPLVVKEILALIKEFIEN